MISVRFRDNDPSRFWSPRLPIDHQITPIALFFQCPRIKSQPGKQPGLLLKIPFLPGIWIAFVITAPGERLVVVNLPMNCWQGYFAISK